MEITNWYMKQPIPPFATDVGNRSGIFKYAKNYFKSKFKIKP